MSRSRRIYSHGFSLVEVIAATAIMAALTTTSYVLVRTAHTAWTSHRDDFQQRRQAAAAVQHIVRRVRQATEVAAISGPTDSSGAMTLLMADGMEARWEHDAATQQILYGVAAADSLLAEGITEFNLVGLTADGATPTTDPDRIHVVQCEVKYVLDRPAGPTTETVAGVAWLRAW